MIQVRTEENFIRAAVARMKYQNKEYRTLHRGISFRWIAETNNPVRAHDGGENIVRT